MEGKLCVLFLALFCVSLCTAQTAGYTFTKFELMKSTTAAYEKTDYPNNVFQGKAGAVGTPAGDFYEYLIEASGSVMKDTKVTMEQLELTTISTTATRDLSSLFGNAMMKTCSTSGAIKFGGVVQLPTFKVVKDEKSFSFDKKFQFKVLVAKDLFCAFTITGISIGGSPKVTSKVTVADADKRTIFISTFSDFRYAVLPNIPAAANSYTWGGATVCPTSKERQIAYQVLTNHGIKVDELKKVIDFGKDDFGKSQCCEMKDAKTCNCDNAITDCQMVKSKIVKVDNDFPMIDFTFSQRFMFGDTNLATVTEGTRRRLTPAKVTEATVSTISLKYDGKDAAAIEKVSIRLSGEENKPVPHTGYVLDNRALQLTGVEGEERGKENTDPLSKVMVKFSKPVSFFRYKKEFIITPAPLDGSKVHANEFKTEFDKRYMVTAVPDEAGTTWTIHISPPIYSPGTYTVSVVTGCTGNCQSTAFSKAFDTVVPIPFVIELGKDSKLTKFECGSGCESHGIKLTKAANCKKPLQKCNNACGWISNDQCAECKACAEDKPVCSMVESSELKWESTPACTAQTQVAKDDAELKKKLAESLCCNTNPSSDPFAGYVRIFPFQCFTQDLPDYCSVLRDTASLWDKAPRLLTNQVYVANRMVTFTVKSLNDLRFNLHSFMCTEKTRVTADASHPNLFDEKRMYVRLPAAQSERNFFQGEAYAVDAATTFMVEFYSLHNEKCISDTYAPLVIELMYRTNRKRSLASIEETLDKHMIPVTGTKDQIQIRAVEADTLDLAMDSKAPTINDAKCSGDGIAVGCYFKLDKPGKVIVTVVPKGPLVPTIPKIFAGQTAAGAMAPHVLIDCPKPGMQCGGLVSGLMGSTDYTAYYIAYDKSNEPNVQDKASTYEFTTSALASTSDSVLVSTEFKNMVNVN